MRTYMHTHVHLHTPIHTHAHVHTHTHTCTHANLHVHKPFHYHEFHAHHSITHDFNLLLLSQMPKYMRHNHLQTLICLLHHRRRNDMARRYRHLCAAPTENRPVLFSQGSSWSKEWANQILPVQMDWQQHELGMLSKSSSVERNCHDCLEFHHFHTYCYTQY